MTGTFYFMIVIITIFTVMAAFIRRMTRDKCLKDFENNIIVIISGENEKLKGKLCVENTGVELIYEKETEDYLYSKIFYKNEFAGIKYFIRYHKDLDDKAQREREKEIRRVYHPNLFRKMTREIMNSFRTIRDSLVDVINVVVGQTTRNTKMAEMLKNQDKYVTKIKKEAVDTISNSYDPLIERHIGNKVVVEVSGGDVLQYKGILKEYSNEFIELLDVELDGEKIDIILNKKYGIIRYLGEKI